MHILKIIHGYPPYYTAGSEVYSQSICNELSKKHKVSIFTREENPYLPNFNIREVFINEKLKIYYVNNYLSKDGYRHHQMDERFNELLKKLNPDIVHIGHLNHLSTGIVDVLNNFNIPIVFTLHDFWLMCPRGQFLTRDITKENSFQLCDKQEDLKCALSCYSVYFSGREEYREDEVNYWRRWVSNRMSETKSIVHKVDLFIAPSRYLMNRFINDFNMPEEKIMYLDYGFPLDYLNPSKKYTKNDVFTFGYIGTHIPAKGVNLLIEAFKKIDLPSKLKIWGYKDNQSTEALKKLACDSKNPIEFCGKYVNKNLADEVFSNVDCIVVPSIWGENSPLVIHEAQACKIPVITADFGGMKEYVKHHYNGLLFKHRDVNSLYEQMIFAILNPDLMRLYGSRGYLYSTDGNVPNITEHCKKLEEIYNILISKKLNKSILL
jgi:glycosyltransferase involved in cell wall biosynthesis